MIFNGYFIFCKSMHKNLVKDWMHFPHEYEIICYSTSAKGDLPGVCLFVC